MSDFIMLIKMFDFIILIKMFDFKVLILLIKRWLLLNDELMQKIQWLWIIINKMIFVKSNMKQETDVSCQTTDSALYLNRFSNQHQLIDAIF